MGGWKTYFYVYLHESYSNMCKGEFVYIDFEPSASIQQLHLSACDSFIRALCHFWNHVVNKPIWFRMIHRQMNR